MDLAKTALTTFDDDELVAVPPVDQDIHLVLRRDNAWPLQSFVSEWAPALAPRVRLWTYQSAHAAAQLPPGLWIFADVDQLSQARLTIGAAIWARLARHGGTVICLNQPGAALDRQALLERLYADGRNRFAVYPLRAWREVTRFPVFIRHRAKHNGTITELIHDAKTLGEVIVVLQERKFDMPNLLIIEFLDTGQDGVFRKYSAFRIGDTILAHHIFHAARWHVKAGSLEMTEDLFAEERAFQRDNPHLDQLREIFDIARIDYGRIDYAMFQGRVQTWEINTNPVLLQPREFYPPAQLPAKHRFADTVVGLLDGLARRAA